MANQSKSPAGTRIFTPVHKRTGVRLRIPVRSDTQIPRGRRWQTVIRDVRTGQLYRAWNKSCGLPGCMCDAYVEECSDRIQQCRDDLKEDFGDPDDLQE